MLKGYIDRVFTAGTAYLTKNGNDRQSLSSKKGAIIMTSEASLDELKGSGVLRDLKKRHERIMEYCGIDLLGQLYLGGIVPPMSPAAGERHLGVVRRFARRIF